MSKSTQIRTDGDFGAIYHALEKYNPKGVDVREVVKIYARRHGKCYRDAWAAWFAWAMGQ